MIEAKQLSKAFRKPGAGKSRVTAITDVSFTAPDGAITGLLGPNGAGKSTTLRILTSLLHPDSGSARIDGHDVVADPLAVRRQIGFLPHNAGLYPRLTSRENLVYFARLCGMNRVQSEERTEELIELLDMQDVADRRTEGFSQGQRTRVALGRALIHSPRTLILDEPTNGLDVMATRSLRALLRRLRDAGHCVLISSHIMQEIARLSDHVAIISDGRIAASGSVSELLSSTGQDDLEDAFVVAIGGHLDGTS
jgi:sodium transport system ATP-binding protein